MNLLAVDDEHLALQLLTDTIQKVLPTANISAFTKPSEALRFAQETTCEIAFLDIQMRSMTGLELARRLKNMQPNINIIFVTGYDEYAGDAMRMHASGYLMKPVTEEKLLLELAELRHPITLEQPQAVLRVQCFGNFDVFTAHGAFVHFERAKAKELFAYLVSKRGGSCNIRSLAGILFEDMPYDIKQSTYMRTILSSLTKSLRAVGAEAVLKKNYNEVAIDTQLLDCDYYRFLRGEVSAVNRYQGEFMAQYSWAEFVTGYIEQKTGK